MKNLLAFFVCFFISIAATTAQPLGIKYLGQHRVGNNINVSFNLRLSHSATPCNSNNYPSDHLIGLVAPGHGAAKYLFIPNYGLGKWRYIKYMLNSSSCGQEIRFIYFSECDGYYASYDVYIGC